MAIASTCYSSAVATKEEPSRRGRAFLALKIRLRYVCDTISYQEEQTGPAQGDYLVVSADQIVRDLAYSAFPDFPALVD